MDARKLASFDIPTRDNIHQYQCNNPILSYDVTVFQCKTSCNKKCYDHMCINTLAGIFNVIDDIRNNNVNFP